MISDGLYEYAISRADQHISVKNNSPVYFNELGYSGNYSILANVNPISYSQASSKSNIYCFICIYNIEL